MSAAPPAKPRRIDFFPDEFLSGVDQLSLEEVGLYWLACSKIYSRGDGLPDDDRDNARIFRLDLRTWKRLKRALIDKGKLLISDSVIINRRCMVELAKAYKRIEDARRAGLGGGRPPATSSEDPPEDSADISPTVTPTVGEPMPQQSANRSQTDADKSAPDLNEINDVTKAPGFGDRKANHQPQPPTPTPTTNLKAREGREEAPHPTPQEQQVVALWNAMAARIGFRQVAKISNARRTLIAERLHDVGNVAQLARVFERVAASAFLRGECNGEGHENWQADFDYVMREDNFVRLIEGSFDDRSYDDDIVVAADPDKR